MELTKLTIKILLILFPGIVTTKIVNRLTERKKENAWEFFIRAFVYGIVTYMLTYVMLSVINLVCKVCTYGFPNMNSYPDILDMNFYKNILNADENLSIEFYNIFIPTFIAVIFSFIIAKFDTMGYLNKLAQKLNVTNKFAEDDVWENIFNSIDENVWITIRDFKNDLMYQGWPQKFSSFHEEKELLLQNVGVYRNSTAEKLFEKEMMYFDFSKEDNFILELEVEKSEDNDTKKEEK